MIKFESQIEKLGKELKSYGTNLDNLLKESKSKESSCLDDPKSQLTKSGITCDQIVEKYGCSLDLSDVSNAPKGFLVSQLCPKTCKVC
mmetsp:Transcript_29121/g.54531  ORF Transcript_29121/g.54531 Transcript_29121/m.54531 type:complete len:88 (-) Transcript_29121:249-512(-)